MNVSVIINTWNRDFWLKRLLDALLYQTYDDFEIIVVNGPSIDKTDEVLEDYKDYIKIRKCDINNICVSRNIGIKAASGEILIFIDDDAIPIDKYYIENYVNSFKNDPELAVTGGLVYNNNWNYQFKNSKISIWGAPYGNYNNEDNNGYPLFSLVPGCNGAYLRKAVVEVGGYDEYYEYYHDESDLCVRLFKAGYKIEYHNLSHIFHENARTLGVESRAKRDWSIIAKNQCYFGYKNSEGLYDLETRRFNIINQARNIKNYFDFFIENKMINHDDYLNFTEMWLQGIKIGEYDGLNKERLINYNLEADSSFKKIDKVNTPKIFNVIFLLPEHINGNGGSVKHTKELANSLFKLGVGVHIVYIGNETNDYMIDGINYYSVISESLNLKSLENYPICNNLLSISYSLYKKVKLLSEMYNINVIETPIWDFSGLLSAYYMNIPVVTRLQTPAKLVSKIQNYNITDDHLLLFEFEKILFKKSTQIIAISDCILETITSLYDTDIKDKTSKNYLGIEDIEYETNIRNDNKIIIFFIGRLERRKGIHNLFDAIPNILNKYKNVEFRLAGADSHDTIINNTFTGYFNEKYSIYQDNVKFLGVISDEQKEEELNNCDIFVSPSIYESFGIIFIEAMRHKKPVIGCNTGGMPEIVINGETGILCEPDNSKDLENVLTKLIEDKVLRETMGQNGYLRFKNQFTGEIMAKGSLEIYRDVYNNYRNKKTDGLTHIFELFGINDKSLEEKIMNTIKDKALQGI